MAFSVARNTGAGAGWWWWWWVVGWMLLLAGTRRMCVASMMIHERVRNLNLIVDGCFNVATTTAAAT
uniref:Uncharacterized protein n=1 Tax=Anopheles braziliensis TaxID=58242 RepID=A0A2M3ZLB9_9DIPT